jgi:hypothetical protein
VSKSTIRTNLYQTADVHRDLPPKVTFHSVFALYDLSQLAGLGVRQISYTSIRADTGHSQDLPAARRADTKNVRESYLDTLVSWEIYSRYSCHDLHPRLALPLLMLWIFLANNPHNAFSADYLTLITHLFN